MSKYVAFEWDDQELRVLSGSPRGEGLVVDRMQVIPLPKEAEPSKTGVPSNLGEVLTKAGLGKTDSIAVISRSRVELKQMALPPSPPEEVPTLVRFQAMREFAKLSEDWPLDYLPLAKPTPSEGEEAHDNTTPVLAAAIAPELLDGIKTASSASGLNLSHVALRPCGSASLFLRRPESAEHRLVVLIDIEDKEADITVLHGRDPVLLRTARLPHNVLVEGASAGALLGEIRRTLPAAHNIVRGERVSGIFFSGASEGHHRLAENIQAALEIPCTAFDPFSQVEVGRKAQGDVANPSVFAPLLGAMLDEIQEAQHAFDFLHPRKPPAPPSQNRRYALIAGAAALLIIAPLAWWWISVSSYENEAEDLAAKIKKLREETETPEAKAVRPLHDSLMQWEDGNVDWLQELERLSLVLEPSDAQANSLGFTSTEVGGRITMAGQASTRAARQNLTDGSQQLYGKLADQWHEVIPGSLTTSNANPNFPVDFSLEINVTKDPDSPVNVSTTAEEDDQDDPQQDDEAPDGAVSDE